MKRKRIIIAVSFCLGIILSSGLIFSSQKQALSSDAVSEEYTINIPEPSIREVGGEAYYEIEDFGSNVALGLPLLPHKKFYFEIPFSAKDISVTLAQQEPVSLGIVTNLAVFQGLASGEQPVEHDLVAARSRYTLATFPDRNFKVLAQRSFKGHRLVTVAVNPLVQDLESAELKFYDNYTLTISYTVDEALRSLDTQMQAKRSAVFEKTAKELIYNYTPQKSSGALKGLDGATAAETVILEPIADVPIEYAIITMAGNESAVQPLADWKTKKGIPAEVFTVEWIEANYSGADRQEKIRKFLTEANPNPPNQDFYTAKYDWLLIAGEQGGGMPDLSPPGGDVKLPARYVGSDSTFFGYTLDYFWTGSDKDVVPADYYYADCADSTATGYDWDTNDNTVYGELADNILWTPDTYVGRIPSNTSAKLSQVVNKIIAYEKNPDVGAWVKEAVLCGAEIRTSPYVHSATLMEAIKDDFLVSAGITDFRLYFDNANRSPQGDAELTETNFENYVNPGRTLVQWLAHGNNIKALVQDGGAIFVRGDTTSLSNGNKRPVGYAGACRNAVFDKHNTGVAVNSYYTVGDVALFGYGAYHDWGIAFIGAARGVYYWHPMVHPSIQGGASGEQYRFNEQIFSLGKYSMGQALYDMKLDMITDFDGNTTYDPDTVAAARKNMFAMNLLGDPEMPMWTDEPQAFNVDYPSEIYNMPGDYTITVTDGASIPVDGARVTLYKQDDVFGTGLTDITGEIIFSVSTISLGDMDITATKHNFIPFEAVVSVVEEEYSLTITVTEGGITFPPPGIHTYSVDFSAEVVAIPYTCYDFDHWELDGQDVGSVNPYSLVMDGDYALHAVFVINNYDLTITADEGGATDPIAGVYTYSCGSSVEVTAIPDANYSLDHWQLDGQDVGSVNPYSLLMDAVHNLEAVFVSDVVCGDMDASGEIDIADLVYIVDYMFNQGPEPTPLCAANVDGDNEVNIADLVYLVDYMFNQGPEPVDTCINQYCSEKASTGFSSYTQEDYQEVISYIQDSMRPAPKRIGPKSK